MEYTFTLKYQLTDDDRDWLMTLEEPQLSRMAPVTAEAVFPDAIPPVVEEPPKDTPPDTDVVADPVSTEDYIAQAPEDVQEVLNEGVKMHRARKDQIVSALVANARNTFSKEDLEAKSLGELESIVSLAADITFAGNAPTLSIAKDSDTTPEPPKLFDLNKTADAA